MVNLNNKTINMKIILVTPKYKSVYEKNVETLDLQSLLGTTNVKRTKLSDGSTLITINNMSKDPYGFYYSLHDEQIVFNKAIILDSSTAAVLSNGIQFFNSPYFKAKEEERLTVKRQNGIGRVWKV